MNQRNATPLRTNLGGIREKACSGLTFPLQTHTTSVSCLSYLCRFLKRQLGETVRSERVEWTGSGLGGSPHGGRQTPTAEGL